jgi:hypothetical protein
MVAIALDFTKSGTGYPTFAPLRAVQPKGAARMGRAIGPEARRGFQIAMITLW